MEIIIISAIWCPSCLVMKKIFKELEQKYSMVNFTYLDYDFDEDLVKEYEVKDILPVFIIKKEQELIKIIGEKSFDTYEMMIKRCL